MRGWLICPGERPGTAFLGGNRPLAAIPILGESMLSYWLNWAAAAGWTEAVILAADRPEAIRKQAGDGGRWGLKIEVRPELRESPLEHARAVCAPEPAEVLDHFPGRDEKIFSGYAEWFAGALAWWPRAAQLQRIGFREIHPGIWTGLRAQVSSSAQLRAPCWLGHHVAVGADATVGPNAILEDRVWVGRGAEVSRSWVGPDTFVGSLVHLTESLAWGSLLINWSTGSATIVPDAFLLSLMGERLQRAWWNRCWSWVRSRGPKRLPKTARPSGERLKLF